MKILSTQSLVDNIEKLIAKVYFYFSQPRKKTLKFWEVFYFLGCEGIENPL